MSIEENYPKYRIRLFVSVDLVGSTAFKAKYSNKRADGAPYPTWLLITRQFYRDFPEELKRSYGSFAPQYTDCIEQIKDRAPQVWKTVGDEIIFCCRLICLEHLAACMTAFVSALEKYGRDLQAREPELDVKGSAWIASFPAPNSTVLSAIMMNAAEHAGKIGDTLGEEAELLADANPSHYDFLGKSIDTGFRISKFAQADELALSIDLAYLLALLKQIRYVGFDFQFRGREPLKGVINGIPYPIVTIETEKSVRRKELLSLERNVRRADFADTVTLRNYLHAFMDNYAVEIPILEKFEEIGRAPSDIYPQCYRDFKENYLQGVKGNDDQERGIIEAEAVPADDQPPNEEVVEQVKKFIDQKIQTYVNKIGKPQYS